MAESKKGDHNLALKNYKKNLDIWKNADNDLPELIDAKKRLAKLSDPYNKQPLFSENNDIINIKNPLMLNRNVFKNSTK